MVSTATIKSLETYRLIKKNCKIGQKKTQQQNATK